MKILKKYKKFYDNTVNECFYVNLDSIMSSHRTLFMCIENPNKYVKTVVVTDVAVIITYTVTAIISITKKWKEKVFEVVFHIKDECYVTQHNFLTEQDSLKYIPSFILRYGL